MEKEITITTEEKELLNIYHDGYSHSLNNESSFFTYAKNTIEYYAYLLGAIHAESLIKKPQHLILKSIYKYYEGS